MTAPLSADRVKELRENIRTGYLIVKGDPTDIADLLRIIDSYSSLRAENERLRHIIDCAKTPLMADVLKERDELKAELEEHNGQIRRLLTDNERQAALVTTAEAELAAARPWRCAGTTKLIEAVMGADIEELGCDSTCAEAGDLMTLSDDSKDILRAALALREEKK
jgi:hypothetical protein